MASTLTVDNIVGATTAASVKTPAGTVLQTQVNKYNTEVSSTSTSLSATGASVTINPKFATSHILVGIQGVVYMFGNNATQEPKAGFKLYRSEGGGSDVEIRSFFDSNNYTLKSEFGANKYRESSSFYFTHLHDVDTTSAVVYKLYFNNAGGSGVIRLNSGSSNTASWAATDVAATITPKYNTSKILVQFTGAIRVYNSSGANASGAWRIYRSVGGASFAQVGTHQMTHRFYDYGSSGIIADQPFHMQYLDSPSTTSAVIYKLYWYKEAGTAMEYNPDGQDETYTTLMEIAQ